MTSPYLEIDGRLATMDALRDPALLSFGHYTSMQIRGGAVRGLALHLRRLSAATRELFGAELSGERVRSCIGHALTGASTRDAEVRVDVFWPPGEALASVMVTVRPPREMPSTPQRLQTVAYQRPVPHVKHAGTFGQVYHARLAQRDGFDDALLIDADGTISESTIANLGCFDGTAVVWPDAPMLLGVTMDLLRPALAARGVPSRTARVRAADLPSFRAVFVSNSRGIAPVGQVDRTALPAHPDFMKALLEAYESVPYDAI